MAAIPAHPFTYSSADVVLYSSDNVVYKVHKLILAIASDFFRDMFDLPQPTSSSDSDSSAPVTEEQVDGLPVIRMLESSKALTPLLMLCYPLEEPVLTSITEVCAVLEAAIKFDLRRASQIAKRRMRELIPSAPLRVYIIACRLGLEDEAHAAAQEIYRSKVQDQYVEKLEEISFGAYHRLLHYCSAGGDAGFGMVSFSPTKSGPKSKKDKKKADVDRSRAITFTVPVSTATPDVSTIGSPTPVLSTGDVNIVLLTSDGQRLPISGNGILYASPLLSALVARRSNIAEEVPVTEPAATMSILIRVYDPFEQPHFADMLDIHAGLIAAEKYGMRKAIDFLRTALRSQEVRTPEESLLLYAIACRFNMRDVALVAARGTLRADLTRNLYPSIDTIHISGGYLHRLLAFHRDCHTAINPVFESRDWLQDTWLELVQTACSPYVTFGNYTGRKWACWYDPYMKAAARSASWPSRESVMQDDVLCAGLAGQTSSNFACPCCTREKGAVLLFKFSQHVADTITRLETQVDLSWPTERNEGPKARGLA